MDDFRIIRTNVLSGVVTEVRLYASVLAHIESEHPEFTNLPFGLNSVIDNAVTNPTKITASYGNSVIFVDERTTSAHGSPLIVPVKLIEGTSGYIKTVLFSSSSVEREILWEAS